MKLAKATISPPLDPNRIRQDFPILHQTVNGHPLVYLDNAATTQKPTAVIEAIVQYYEQYNSNVHRGAHHLSAKATEAYEQARTTVAGFIHARSEAEINFTRGTTESINLVAQTYGRRFISKGDHILISAMEHHSNIVPWQMLCEEKQAQLQVIPVDDTGALIMEEFEKQLSEKTKFVAVTYVSNALGTVNPVKEIIKLAHQAGAVVLLDAAQAVQHFALDVQELDCDFLCFSGHKLYGPTGIGVLYGKEKLLEQMPPWQGGGEMIKEVTFQKTTYNDIPYKFEAGTPHIEGAIGLAAAINYLTSIGLDTIYNYEHELLHFATALLNDIDGLRIIGTAPQKAPVISFLLENVHPFDAGTLLNTLGIAIRTGHHCCQPLMQRMQIDGTCRASLAFYNTKEEMQKLAEGIKKVKNMF
ncbi:MAG: cysteine desulfurase [Chitinophagales bacterium]|nr:MAG: cysteine desulfurase [Chitinophagales bacterium]